MLKKVKNFFNWPLTTGEIIKLLQEHMTKVCGKCTDIDPDDLYLVDVKNVIKGYDFVIMYKWNDLYWEISFQREASAYSLNIAHERYENANMEQFSILHWLYVVQKEHKSIYVSVKGRKTSNLRLKRIVKK